MKPIRKFDRPNGKPPITEVLCCGRWVRCQGFTNECPDCGTEYNFNGAALYKHWRLGEAGDYLNEGEVLI